MISSNTDLIKNNFFSINYLRETETLLQEILKDPSKIEVIESMAQSLKQLRETDGRLFILGVGGSAANASHAVNDFRKICAIETYAPTDNVSELSARTNDEGFHSVFIEYLKISKFSSKDAILILSVGGGNIEKNISPNLVKAIQHAHEIGAKVLGIVGKDGGYTAKNSYCTLIIPTVNSDRITAHSEETQGIILHLLASHPLLKVAATKWESVK
ncbi:MAG: SIS domain-containing protein [Oligoflexia bacterium]|nr:SIS domain-containing protein [Oligoflexia bacterium]